MPDDPESRPGPGAVDLGWALDIWPAVIDAVREENAMLATLLGGARPLTVGGGELTLAFPADAAFFKRKAEQDEHRRVAVETFRSVTGHPLGLRYVLSEAAVAEDPSAGGRTLSGDELVQRFMDEFNAEELADEPEFRPEDGR
jgi:hypothetical protein